MGLRSEIIDIFRKDWNLFLATNALFFGATGIGALVAFFLPETQVAVLAVFAQELKSGTLSPVGGAYGTGNILKAAWMTFANNLVYGTIQSLTLPSFLFPPYALLMGVLRALTWGIAFIIPQGQMTLRVVLPHLLTLLIEGEAYVIAIFGCLRQAEGLLWPARLGETSRVGGYLRAVRDNVRLLIPVTVILVVGALYEAFELLVIAGLYRT
ncbi:hypothetical protein [Methanocella arvoryzae]|uniref:Stage II sporulation protein M n=1 Tax=Methanocella arvoryzae (strain DSM 22066 / NBRC 105507 / MRE50) TaxID=351160 RepID=Q0W6H3_METAR|nr:hypothetical protein [Methanocella arvoryzae]CAJ36020.1 hypothetical protein RCIX614 [Methanocella arvoryzae MRE50]